MSRIVHAGANFAFRNFRNPEEFIFGYRRINIDHVQKIFCAVEPFR